MYYMCYELALLSLLY